MVSFKVHRSGQGQEAVPRVPVPYSCQLTHDTITLTVNRSYHETLNKVMTPLFLLISLLSVNLFYSQLNIPDIPMLDEMSEEDDLGKESKN